VPLNVLFDGETIPFSMKRWAWTHPTKYRAANKPRRAFFIVVAVCAALAVCGGNALSSPPVGGGKFVLVGVSLNVGDGGRDGLYVMNADGRGLRQITRSGDQPHWSRDGGSIAFVDGGIPGRVVVMRADGSGRRTLGSAIDPSLAAPDPWSPDDRRLAWGGCDGLCVSDLASSRRTRIALGGRDDFQGFSWSPNGRKLAAVDQSRGLVVVNLSGKQLAVLSNTGTYPAWSPDGRQVAFLSGSKLELVPASGGTAYVVARHADSPPIWSRDGKRLLYTDFVRRPVSSSVRVLNVVTHTNTRIGDTGGIAHWSPDGSTIVYGRRPIGVGTGQDLWLAQANGHSVRQLTGEFPTGLSYSDLDWTSGAVPPGTAISPPTLLQLQATGELKLDALDGSIGRAATPDSVVFRADQLCNADAETVSATLNVWTPSTGSTVTSSTPCQDFEPGSYAVTSAVDAWVSQSDLNGNETLAAMRPGTNEATPIAQWTSGEESPDIGWRADISEPLVSDSTIVFETGTSDGTSQLWQIADGAVPHAIPIPLPPDKFDLLDADAGRIVIRTTRNDLAVLNTGGVVLSHIPFLGTARIGGDLLAIAAGNTLRVYDPDSGTLRYQRPLAHSAGHPRLLTIGAGYAAYASGIELHLVRLDNGNDRIADLPGQAGPLQALLTPDGLFIAYMHAYDPKPARILFVPEANLP
jgi:Tol biopolymer transport system component